MSGERDLGRVTPEYIEAAQSDIQVLNTNLTVLTGLVTAFPDMVALVEKAKRHTALVAPGVLEDLPRAIQQGARDEVFVDLSQIIGAEGQGLADGLSDKF